MKTVMKKYLFLFILVLGLAIPTLAHHSFAMFEMGKELKINGTVKVFDWVNPHVWIELAVPSANGEEVWRLEAGSTVQLGRLGWRSNAFAVGDKITATLHPLKNGEKGGNLMSVILSNGAVLNGGGPSAVRAPGGPEVPGAPGAGAPPSQNPNH